MKNIINTKRSILEAFVMATVITGLLIIATQIAGNELNWLENIAVFFSFACTWLTTRQVRFSYVLAIISTALLSITFWQAGLLGSMALNIYLIPTVIYGWFIWGKDSNPRPVQRVKGLNALGYIGITAITWMGAYAVIKFFNGEMGALDGWLLVGTVLAQFLLDRKKLENWIVWILVNVVSVYVYFNAGLYLLSAQFLLFLVNAVYAFYKWKKTMNLQEEENVSTDVAVDLEPVMLGV